MHIVPSEILKKFDPSFNNPLEIEKKLRKLRIRDKMEDEAPETSFAFGKCLPMQMKHKKRMKNVEDVKPCYPQDLKTKEALFKGIEHLQ